MIWSTTFSKVLKNRNISNCRQAFTMTSNMALSCWKLVCAEKYFCFLSEPFSSYKCKEAKWRIYIYISKGNVLGYINVLQAGNAFGHKMLHTGEYYSDKNPSQIWTILKKCFMSYWHKNIFTKLIIKGNILVSWPNFSGCMVKVPSYIFIYCLKPPQWIRKLY